MDYLKKITLLLLLTALSTGCGTQLSTGSSVEPPSSIGKKITGKLTLTTEQDFNLNEDLKKETLALIFAQDTCTTCSAEAKEISEKITQDLRGRLPDHVEIVTFLVGLSGEFALEDAKEWKESHKVQWKVGVQKDSENLFKRYFPGSSTVPALLVQKEGKIVFQHTGALGVDQLEGVTGEWK